MPMSGPIHMPVSKGSRSRIMNGNRKDEKVSIFENDEVTCPFKEEGNKIGRTFEFS